MKQRSRADLLAVYQKYLNGFVTEDMDAINECIEYPFTHVGETSVKTFDHFPLSPSEMKKAKGWATSDNFEIEVVAQNETKAHLILKNCRRLRFDGSVIENVSAFYAFKLTNQGWKMFAISDVLFPE
jgi:hypothetical protein